MNQVLLQLLNGLVVGSSLALVAAGLALLFGVLHIINFAQGDFFMMGGYAVWFSLNLTHNYVAAMAGGLLLPLLSVYPTVGGDVIQNAFIIVVAGGLGNFRGAAIVALLVGEFNSLGQLIPNVKPSVLTLILFGLVILLLMVRARRQHALVRL